MNQYFEISVEAYDRQKQFRVFRPASLKFPKDNAVMFITEGFMDCVRQLTKCKECLVFWPEKYEIPEQLRTRHAVILCRDPHVQFCKFFRENAIVNYPKKEDMIYIEGSWIGKKARLGKGTTLFPGCYISGDAVIGEDVWIGSGVKLLGSVIIGNHVLIRENTVIGADGLTTDRDEFGKAVTMPQFGGVEIEDNVQIGANTTIARGAIDNTVIHEGSKIDNNCFISHNVEIGADTFVVGETIMFGSSSTGEQAYISGNAAIRNGIHIGSQAIVGMGAVVVKNVDDGKTVKGNPAK